ncbi:MAG TPA: proteasome ATPase, partial [Jatrophihabitantaceae bacterium]
DAIELPYLYGDLFHEHELDPPKGILLYGPPGCGKTLIAKAVANSLAKQVQNVSGGDEKATSYFLNIKGPELLNKYVGETERHIRLVFQRAREKASEGTPVIVFFDEMDSIFRTRGSGVSSDVENTIVPQLLSEIDGVEGLENVIVIGASNREDMIDPAILRPGRLDVKIKIERPDAEAARDIFSKYILPGLPIHPDDLGEHGGNADATVDAMIQHTVERMYTESEENRFLEVTYANGDKETLYFKDFNSGAMIQNIVDRGKKMAIKDFLTIGQKGLRLQHLLAACVDEFRENEDLPNTTNPDDWARISGKKGERIVYIRTLVSGGKGSDAGRSIDTIGSTGQYL